VRSNAAVFGILAVFCTIADIVYWFGSKDPTGTTALGISAGLGILISFYLYFTVSRIGEQPQDINDAEIADGAGELGHFSPASWWPLVIAASALLVFPHRRHLQPRRSGRHALREPAPRHRP